MGWHSSNFCQPASCGGLTLVMALEHWGRGQGGRGGGWDGGGVVRLSFSVVRSREAGRFLYFFVFVFIRSVTKKCDVKRYLAPTNQTHLVSHAVVPDKIRLPYPCWITLFSR